MGTNDPRGSIWRKWDLHVHTIKSYEHYFNPSSWDTYIKELINKAIEYDISAIGINDYFTIEGYQYIYENVAKKDENGNLFLEKSNKKIYLFPIVELRTNNFIRGKALNIHILFDNKITPQIIKNDFLEKLRFEYNGTNFELKRENLLRIGRELTNSSDDDSILKAVYMQITVSKDSLKEAIDEFIKRNKERLIVILVGKSKDGIPPSFFEGNGKLNVEFNNFLNIHKDLCIFTNKKEDIEKFVKNYKKACLWGSDAHRYEDLFVPSGDGRSFTWIKADPTFLGLLQAIRNPEDRIFIGDRPPIFKRLEEEPSKFINSLSIKFQDGYDGSKGKWFEDINIEFNPGFIAIIGNKGNGKSAIVDILGLCGNSKNYEYFAFLRKERFCNPRSKVANNFLAVLQWNSGKEVKKVLNENPNINELETVRYLPQNYFEHLTAELDGHKNFENRIKEIIFQYLPDDKKYGMDSLDDLIEFLSENTEGQISPLNGKIEKINKELVDLEIKREPSYLMQIENKKKNLEEEISNLEKIKEEKEISLKKISNSLKEKDSKLTKIEELNRKEKEYSDEAKKLKEKSNKLKRDVSELTEFKKWIKNLKLEFEDRLKEKEYIAKNFSLNLNKILEIRVDFSSIEDKIKSLEEEKSNIDKQVENIGNELLKIKQEKEDLAKSLEYIESEYQQTLNDLNDITNKIEKLIGEEFESGTLKWFEKEIKFIKEEIKNKLAELRDEKIKLSLEIHNRLKNLVNIYRNLKYEVDRELKDYVDKLRSLNYNLEIDARLEIKNKEDFIKHILNFVDRRASGFFRSNDGDSYEKFIELIDKFDFNNEEDIKEFLLEFIKKLDENKNFPIKQMKGKNESEQKESLLNLYNYIFSPNLYLKPTYILKLGDRPLEVLSPGEKGAILLIFHLMLDKDNIPLIIDQPEENLDNESIFKILVDFIKEVKNRRQIILVTHNPNLAVASDADQIIHVSIDRQNGNKVKIKSGSLENPEINKIVTDILEGTLKAFKIRDERYIKI